MQRLILSSKLAHRGYSFASASRAGSPFGPRPCHKGSHEGSHDSSQAAMAGQRATPRRGRAEAAIHSVLVLVMLLCVCCKPADHELGEATGLLIQGQTEGQPDARDEELALTVVLSGSYYHQYAHYFMPVEYDGELPGEFSARVVEPPPTEAGVVLSNLLTGEGLLSGEPALPGEHYPPFCEDLEEDGAGSGGPLAWETGTEPGCYPRGQRRPPLRDAALGYLAVVPRDHASSLPRVRQEHKEVVCDCGARGCSLTTWCTDGEDPDCYEEQYCCPSSDNPNLTVYSCDECTLERTSGDPRLKQQLWDEVVGLVDEYAIVYLAYPAPKGSLNAYLLGAPDGLEAGYHLLEVTRFDESQPPDLAEQERLSECYRAARELATERYNRKHGTNHSTRAVFDFQGEVGSEVERFALQAKIELGCPRGYPRFAPVPSDTPLTLALGQVRGPAGVESWDLEPYCR